MTRTEHNPLLVSQEYLTTLKDRLGNAQSAQFKAWKYVKINKPKNVQSDGSVDAVTDELDQLE